MDDTSFIMVKRICDSSPELLTSTILIFVPFICVCEVSLNLFAGDEWLVMYLNL